MLNSKFESQKYFQSITSREIEEKLLFLRNTLPLKSTRKNYQLSKDLLKINDTITEEKLQDELQEIADRMRAHLFIDRYIKILTMSNVEAGKFERIDDLHCIYINGSLLNQNFQQKVAILAHEMSHYYLIYQHRIYLSDNNENELLTELNAIYVGFGFLLLKGYKALEKREGNMIHRSRVGYIAPLATKKAIVKTAYLRKQNPIWILENAGFDNIIFFLVELFPLLKDYYRVKLKR